jgi:hypothetical protein
MTPQPRTDIPQPTPLSATEPLFLQNPESRKKVLEPLFYKIQRVEKKF